MRHHVDLFAVSAPSPSLYNITAAIFNGSNCVHSCHPFLLSDCLKYIIVSIQHEHDGLEPKAFVLKKKLKRSFHKHLLCSPLSLFLVPFSHSDNLQWASSPFLLAFQPRDGARRSRANMPFKTAGEN